MLKQFLYTSDVHSCKRVWLVSALRRMQRDLVSLDEGGNHVEIQSMVFFLFVSHETQKKLSQKIFISVILVIPLIYSVWRKKYIQHLVNKQLS